MARAKKAEAPARQFTPQYEAIGREWGENVAKAGYQDIDFLYKDAHPPLVALGLQGPALDAAAEEVCEAAMIRFREVRRKK
jgi:hypothetical protein